MNLYIAEIRSNSRALIQQSRDLAKKSKVAIERARTLSDSSRMMREEMQPKSPRRRRA